ncbi:MAG: glycerate kinase [Acidobacteria bacterium]|nr:glycerate kinase [Acidobacteriota bacterium]
MPKTAVNPLKRDALAIFKAGLAAADPARAVEQALAKVGDRYRRILVVGAGKAGATMARAAERALGSRIAGGLINVKDGHTAKLRRIELNECGHPIPDERGVDGARRIAEIVRSAGPGDLVLCLISGGGSALLPYPAEGLTLADKQETTRCLLACGATIHEINAVRKHLSAIKGGRLALLAQPAPVLALLLSDVIGDDLSVIGSGPTAPDESTYQGALEALDKYGIRAAVPEPVRKRLEAGARGEVEETPKELSNARNIVVGSNRLAVDAAERKAKELGYRTLVLATTIEGETRDIARMHAAIAKEVLASRRPVRAPACILSGGETTVTLRGKGLGGRNQEFALAAALDIAGAGDVAVLSAGTDGTDGPTDAAGAFADSSTLMRSAAKGLDAKASLRENDSYHFFEPLNDLVKTGPTGTNVMDLRILLVR